MMRIELDDLNEAVSVYVGKALVQLDLTVDYAINDVTTNMKDLPGTLGWYHRVREAAANAHANYTREFKAWRATFLRDVYLDNPKLAEWKAQALMAAEPEWAARTKSLDELMYLVRRLDGALKALDTKGHMLRSIGAMSRAEMTHLNISTRGKLSPENDSDDRDVSATEAALRSRLTE